MTRRIPNHTPLGVCVVALVVVSTSAAGEGAGGAPSVDEILHEFASTYSEAPTESVAVVVQCAISPPGESWYVSVLPGGQVELHEGSHDAPVMTITMSKNTLDRIYQGNMTALTAGAKASGADAAPLEVEFHPPAEQLMDPKGTMLGFLQHFFASMRPERILLGETQSRVVHGAHAIPLYYARGFRSAWFKVKNGQRLNEPGDSNPFPQAFVVISGRGRAKIGEAELEVRAGESYYIPPDSDHVLWSAPGDSLEVIWLAWGEGA